ncbi:hypothetical protein B9Z19DRAFT_545514 [Tuber borchii]|uniref:Uncharacterized protein n=1 Tax=Tuber borchii TaxID=42251 RepID=A0A2T6ZD16_TUBBO|nr:hypothetical protein B9Z19DRAFT_545514 [Tuber borchii]
MRSRNPLTMAFYAIPSIHHQRGVPIRAFSMALQSLLKGGSLCRVFLDIWKVLTLKPDSGSVRHAIMEPFDDSRSTPSHLSTAKRTSPYEHFPWRYRSLLKGESICRVFLDVWKALTLKPDSWCVRHAITKPFYDGVLRHPICPPPKGRPHTSISHGATEFSEGGVLMAGFLSADFIARFRVR